MSKRFYQIATSGRTADINIYGNITADADIINAVFDADVGGVSSKGIVQEIADLDVDTINVYINSYGGEVAEALAIYSALKRHSASIHTYCDGFACSAATIVFCAGDIRTMGSIALMMIHNCMSYLGYANSEEMRKAAEDNDKINQSSINAYLAVSNLSEDRIREMMSAETWLTAQECLDYGFATEIAEQEEDGTAQQSAFGMIRAAVLNNGVLHESEGLTQIDQKLDRLLRALQADDDEDEDEDPDPDEDDDIEPEEDPDDDDDEETVNKAKEFFNKLFS